MTAVIIFFHVVACIGLIIIVLIQRGRGGGLVESFAGMESMFGTKTSVFLTKATTIMSVVFFVTCLLLAVMSVRKSTSLMKGARIPAEQKSALGHPKTPVPSGPDQKQKSVPDAAKTPSSDAAAPQAQTQEASQSVAPAASGTQPQEEAASASK